MKGMSILLFPGVPSDLFDKWLKLELAHIDIFLWTTWGLFIIASIVGWILYAMKASDDVKFDMVIGYFVVWLSGLTVSAIKGSKAAKLKKSIESQWPPKK
jgi:hypothetical protein